MNQGLWKGVNKHKVRNRFRFGRDIVRIRRRRSRD
jgi:hypothetical protein